MASCLLLPPEPNWFHKWGAKPMEGPLLPSNTSQAPQQRPLSPATRATGPRSALPWHHFLSPLDPPQPHTDTKLSLLFNKQNQNKTNLASTPRLIQPQLLMKLLHGTPTFSPLLASHSLFYTFKLGNTCTKEDFFKKFSFSLDK